MLLKKCLSVLLSCMSLCETWVFLVLAEVRRGGRIPWNWSYKGCEPPLNPGPQEEQQVLLTAEPSSSPPPICLNTNIVVLMGAAGVFSAPLVIAVSYKQMKGRFELILYLQCERSPLTPKRTTVECAVEIARGQHILFQFRTQWLLNAVLCCFLNWQFILSQHFWHILPAPATVTQSEKGLDSYSQNI